MQIRAAKLSDAPAISALLNKIIATKQFTILEPLSAADQLEFMRAFPASGVFLVAEENNQILGLQDVSPSAIAGVGDIGTFVALNAQERGVGKALADATLLEARAKGYRKLMAMIRADNPRVIGFYGSLGFRIVGTLVQHVLAHGVLHDEVLMEKLLEQ